MCRELLIVIAHEMVSLFFLCRAHDSIQSLKHILTWELGSYVQWWLQCTLHLPSGSSFVAFFLSSGFTPMHDSSVTITTRRSSRSTSTCSNSNLNWSLSHSPHCEHCFKSPQPSAALLTVTFFMTYYSIASLLARLASSCTASCSFTQSKFSKTCQQSVCYYMVAIIL